MQDGHDYGTRRQLIRSVIQDVGPSLVAGILRACMFDIPRSMVCHSAEVFAELLSVDRAVSPEFQTASAIVSRAGSSMRLVRLKPQGR